MQSVKAVHAVSEGHMQRVSSILESAAVPSGICAKGVMFEELVMFVYYCILLLACVFHLCTSVYLVTATAL